MKADEYLHSNERVLCKTSCRFADHSKTLTTEKTGTVACTDSRLVFSTGKTIHDLDLGAVTKIEYTPSRVPMSSILQIAFGIVLAFLSLLAESIIALVLPDIPPLILVFGLLASLSFIIAGAINAYQRYVPEMVVHTPKSKYKFFRGDLEKFPHAIRGSA